VFIPPLTPSAASATITCVYDPPQKLVHARSLNDKVITGWMHAATITVRWTVGGWRADLVVTGRPATAAGRPDKRVNPTVELDIPPEDRAEILAAFPSIPAIEALLRSRPC
jgi:hypothetical protein